MWGSEDVCRLLEFLRLIPYTFGLFLFSMYVRATKVVIVSSQQFALEISFPLPQEILSFLYQYFESEWMLSVNYNKQKIKAMISENCQ